MMVALVQMLVTTLVKSKRPVDIIVYLSAVINDSSEKT